MCKKQSGAVLIVSLIILFSLTLFVLSGSQTVVVQEKMTSAVRDLHVSLEIAESGMKDAEAYIEGLSDVDDFNSTGNNGLYSQGNGPSDLFADAIWTNALTRTATTEVSADVVASYYIEDMGEVFFSSNNNADSEINGYGVMAESSTSEIFKIVTRSTGLDGNTERIIVSYYAKSL